MREYAAIIAAFLLVLVMWRYTGTPKKQRLPVIKSCTDCKHSTPLLQTSYRDVPQLVCTHPALRSRVLAYNTDNTLRTNPPDWCPLRGDT
jgi:hypothetical protein